MDIFIGSLFLGGSASNIRLQETGADPIIAFLPTGTYWFHGDDMFEEHESNDQINEVGQYPGLFHAIEQELNPNAINTYSITVTTLSGPNGPRGTRFSIRAVNSNPVTFRLTSLENQFDLRHLGFEDPDETFWSDDPGVPGDDDYEIISTRSIPYRWTSHSLLDGEPSDRRSWDVKDIAFSDEDIQRAYSLKVVSRRYRDLEYEHLPPHAVFGSRSQAPTYIGEQGYLSGDTGASFQEIWNELSRSARGDLLGLDPVLVVYDVDSLGNTDPVDTWHLIDDVGSGWEALQLSEQDDAREYEQLFEMMNLKGELYRMGPTRWFIEYSEFDF